MKLIIFITLTTLALLSFTLYKKPKRIVFFGDSITEAGIQPGGYITKIQGALTTDGKAKKYSLIGEGIGGNKVYDLYLRLEEDVLAHKPDKVFIYVGVNDVWHKQLFGTGTDPDKFVKFYSALIKKMQAKSINVVLCTPACIGEKKSNGNALDKELNQFSDLIRDLAKQYNCQICDLRQSFQVYQAANNVRDEDKNILTTDGVHLNDKGNALVADLMLQLL